MEAEELRQRYAGGKRDFSWASLPNVNLAGANLAGINLYQANLAGANLSRANLSQANLLKANLTGANLTGANLTKANLRKANLAGACWENVLLEATNLAGATLPDGTVVDLLQGTAPVEAEAPPESLSDPNEAPLEVAPIAPPADPTPPFRRISLQALRDSTPWGSLFFLWIGYLCFGILLALHQAPILAWLLAWVGTLGWVVNETFAWFIPVIGASAVIATAGVSLWTVMIIGVVILSLFCNLKFLLGWSAAAALRDSFWVGGLGLVFLTAGSWLLDGSNAYGGGGIVLSLTTFHLALLLIVGIVASGLGAIAWLQLQSQGFSNQQTMGIFSGVAAIGLVCGGIAQLVL